MQFLTLFLALIITSGIILYHRLSLKVWTIASVIVLLLFSFLGSVSTGLVVAWVVVLAIGIIFGIPSLRQRVLLARIFAIYKKIMPKMSSTEKEALDAGTITWEAELFSGKPHWNNLLNLSPAQLTAEEQAFIDGPLAELCSKISDWDITHYRMDMAPEMWQFIKEKGFFGFIIPKTYGGLDFSPYAISRILVQLYTCSASVASTVGVPNSLGPGELLLKYGTDEQKNYYLPRLAKGLEVPCFALTGVEAGSDAASISDTGVVCKGVYEGKEVLGVRLNFNKRYITLAPVATLVGLAFKLYDPEHLIGQVDSYGITCALIPRNTAGMEIGRRHFPVNQAFMNGPIKGKDVFIPLDFLIGGPKMAGQGWRMLMECLAAGRAVTLPSSGVSGGVIGTHATGAYANIRRQFNLPIGRFEGVQEAMARIGGRTYLMDAGLRLTLHYLNLGEKSAVAAAICKYHVTEMSRLVMNDAMDVHGGKAIQMGPRNYLARAYESQPVAITVEGANILTRSLIIYGQGAIRCHPYVLKEMQAALANDLAAFDDAFSKHIGHVLSNFVRAFWMGITNARFVKTPVQGPAKRYYQLYTRYSAGLAFVSDMSMFLLGASIKRKEKLSARLGDILSYLYLGSGVLKRFYDEGSQAEDAALMHWSSRELSYQTQESFHHLLRNFPGKFFPALMRWVVFPRGRGFSTPLDKFGEEIVEIMLTPSEARDRLTAGAYIPNDINHVSGLLKITLEKVIAAEDTMRKVQEGLKAGKMRGNSLETRLADGVKNGIITEAEQNQLLELQTLTLEVINVDDFTTEELMRRSA